MRTTPGKAATHISVLSPVSAVADPDLQGKSRLAERKKSAAQEIASEHNVTHLAHTCWIRPKCMCVMRIKCWKSRKKDDPSGILGVLVKYTNE